VRKTPLMRAQTSFSDEEIAWLDRILDLTRRRLDARLPEVHALLREPAGLSMMKKVGSMRATLESQRALRLVYERGTP
jgi:hypothetical protein